MKHIFVIMLFVSMAGCSSVSHNKDPKIESRIPASINEDVIKVSSLDNKETAILNRISPLMVNTYPPIPNSRDRLELIGRILTTKGDDFDKAEAILTIKLDSYEYFAGISLGEFFDPRWQGYHKDDQKCLFLDYFKDKELKSKATMAIYLNAIVENEKILIESSIIIPKTKNDLNALSEVCIGTKKLDDFPDRFSINPFEVKFIKRY